MFLNPDLVKREAAKVMIGNSPRQCLRRLLEEVRGSAAQHQVAPSQTLNSTGLQITRIHKNDCTLIFLLQTLINQGAPKSCEFDYSQLPDLIIIAATSFITNSSA